MRLVSKLKSEMSFLAIGASIVFAATPAFAQETGPVEAEQSSSDEIIVTARKRAESTQDVPVAITAIGEETIQRYDLTSLERVAAATPSFRVGRAGTGSGATLVLRGIGSNTTSIGLEQSVAVVVDAVYYGQGRTINEGFFDLGQIEILKGPQALFFGKNATAGVVSMVTKDPGSDLEVIGRVGYEFKGEELVGETIISGPLSDTFGARLAVRASKQYGTLFPNSGTQETWRLTNTAVSPPTQRFLPAAISDREPGNRELLARLTLKYEPSDDLTATVKASYNDVKADNPLTNYVNFLCPRGGANQLNPAVPCGREHRIFAGGAPAEVGQDIPFGSDTGELGNHYRAWGITGTLNYELDNVTITSVTNYNWNRNTFRCDCNIVSASPIGLYATEDTDYRAFSSELRALTEFDGPFNVMLGGLYSSTKRNYNAWTAQAGLENSAAPAGFRFVGNSKDSVTKGETLALFGQAIWNIMPTLELAGGVRYTHETKDSYFIQPYSHPALAAVFSPGVRLTADQTFNNWSPEVSLTWEPSDEVTVYGAFKTAYKSGGFSNSGIFGPRASVNDFTFGPETAEGFEVGIKTRLFDRQLSLNLGAYTYEYSDLQIDFFNSPVFAFTTLNAATARTKGIELDFRFVPNSLQGFELHGSLNYNKAEYTDYPDAPCWTGQTIAQGCYTTTPRTQQDLAGVELGNAPNWTGSLGASYETDLDGLNFGLSVDANYSSDYLGAAFGNPFQRQNDYITLDGQVRVSTPDDRWEFAVIGKNLTDKFYFTGGQDGPSSGGGTGTAGGFPADQFGYAANPRTIRAQVTFRY